MVNRWPLLLGFICCFVILAAGFAPLAMAADMPAAAAQDNDAFIRLTPDSTRIVNLDQDAASVIVTNPAHARVLLDTPRMLIVMPRTPGTTPLTVLNAKGETILQKTIIVTATAKPQYVRIRRMCGQAGSGSDCVPTSYFYCPDGCYEVSPVDPGSDNADVPVPQGNNNTANNTQPNVAFPVENGSPEAQQQPPVPQNEEPQ